MWRWSPEQVFTKHAIHCSNLCTFSLEIGEVTATQILQQAVLLTSSQLPHAAMKTISRLCPAV